MKKFKKKIKQIISTALASSLVLSMLPTVTTMAEETQKYPYTMFASSDAEGAITVNSSNFCVNGNVTTNGTIVSSGNINTNGIKKENANEDMIYIFNKIDSQYYSGSNVDEHTEDYTIEEMNINVNIPTEVQGEATLTGNININTALKAFADISLYGEVKNTNNSVIFSKYGDIIIDSQNVNLNGLVYAPFGDVEITAQNLNLNNVVIIADSITFNCPSVNANYSNIAAEFTGNISEQLNIPNEEWQYMKDENENSFPDFFEDFNNWSKLNDMDKDGLPDSVEQYLGSNPEMTDSDMDGLDDYYEVFVTYTDPAKSDSDDNDISDGFEDFDSDSLINVQEYINNTEPYNEDSDGDNLKDGEEISIYHTNPLKKDTDDDGLDDGDELVLGTNPTLPDTDGNGIIDGDEKFSQTFTHIIENEDCAIDEITISMNGSGNLQNNASVKSVMGTDTLSSEVVGLVGEPFEIKTTSVFDEAVLTFKVDQSKLGDTSFDDLMFLWYDEENNKYVELETNLDAINSTVSTTVTHFSRYMIIDRTMWFEAWSTELNYHSDSHAVISCDTVLAVDCSGSMSDADPIKRVTPNSQYDYVYYTSNRHQAANNFIDSLDNNDRAAVLTFTSYANYLCHLTTDKETLKSSLDGLYSNGGTNFDNALRASIDELNSSTWGNRQYIILLSDGASSVSSSILTEAKDDDIIIHTIGIGSGSNDSVLKQIASATGGEFFKATSADELVDLYTKIGIGMDFDTTDNDEDGLYDVVEVAGIRLQNGKIITTDPTLPDTDFDGLKDGEEIDPTIRQYYVSGMPSDVASLQPYYFAMISHPRYTDYDEDDITDINDSKPLVSYQTKRIWKDSDSDYSTPIQSELLMLDLAWRFAITDTDKIELEERANEVRDIVASGLGRLLDKGKIITGAAADEFSWFLGGDVGSAERDYWLYEVNKLDPTVTISEEKTFHAIMFIAGLIEPSPDDAWRLISKKASKEMLETVGESGAKKFLKSINKVARSQGDNGIKKLKGAGIKGFEYEVKVKGKGGAYRLLGNMTENGEIFWEKFEKTH